MGSPLVTEPATSDSGSSAPRKSPPPSEVPSFSPSSPSCQFDEDTGETSSVLPTPSPARCTVSADPSTYDSSLLPAEPDSSADPSPRNLCRWLGLKTSTPAPAEVPLPSETSPRPLSRLSAQPTSSLRPTSGRTRSSPCPHTRNSPTTWPRTTSREASSARKSRNIKFLSLQLLEDLSKNGTHKKKK